MGLSLLNMGNKLTYVHSGDSLPRQLRAGVSYQHPFPNRQLVTITADLPYYMVDQTVNPAMGVDFSLGLISLRAGYQTDRDLGNFSVGAGFLFGSSSLDYAFGLVNDLNPRHQISFSFQFGSSVAREPAIIFPVTEKLESPLPSVSVNENTGAKRMTLGVLDVSKSTKNSRQSDVIEAPVERRVYVVQPGDTLSIISKKCYGSPLLWKKIYVANQHIIRQPENIKAGQKILIP